MRPVAGRACLLNSHRDAGMITPASKEGCRLQCQGRSCWMSGIHRFSPQLVGGANRIEVHDLLPCLSTPCRAAAP